MSLTPAVEMQHLLARSEELMNAPQSPHAQADLRCTIQRSRELFIELMRENEQLRVQNLRLERQKLEADQRLNHDRLGIENQQLKAELELLNTRLAELENKSKKFRRRYEDIEQYSTTLSNIYIATTQLHSTLDFSEVVRTSSEILWNLIAAPVFAIFLRNENTGDFMLVGGEGIEDRFAEDVLREPTGLVAEAMQSGESRFLEAETSGDPLACVPLKVEGRGVVGLINIYEIEPHKGGLSQMDKELFDLLASQTATALTSSRVYTETVKKLKSMESFINLIKPV